MARYTRPVCRLCRREGTKLYLKGERCFTLKCPVAENSDRRVRAFPPGMHGRDRQRQGSEYLTQLREKQKARRIYGILEKQFRNLDVLDRSVPGWLEKGENGFSVTVRVVPQREQIDESIQEQLIVELYSK